MVRHHLLAAGVLVLMALGVSCAQDRYAVVETVEALDWPDVTPQLDPEIGPMRVDPRANNDALTEFNLDEDEVPELIPPVAMIPIPDRAYASIETPPAPDVLAQTERLAGKAANAAAALVDGNEDIASNLLTDMSETLSVVVQSSPGITLLAQLDRMGIDAVAGAPPYEGYRQFFTQLQDLADEGFYIDPTAVSAVRRARGHLIDGRTNEGVAALQEARAMLAEDLAVGPAEEAYARVASARQALEADNGPLALRLLHGVPEALTELQASLPLVPVRFALRAAAANALDGDVMGAQTMVAHAQNRLEYLSANAAPDGTAPLYQDLESAVASLQRRLDARVDTDVASARLNALADGMHIDESLLAEEETAVGEQAEP